MLAESFSIQLRHVNGALTTHYHNYSRDEIRRHLKTEPGQLGGYHTTVALPEYCVTILHEKIIEKISNWRRDYVSN